MSKEADFSTQWNGLLDYKIDEQNLRRPNFQFFYSALESLLRSLNFNIDVAKTEAANSIDPDRTYYIMFCGFVQRLYQLSDPTFKFYFFDLINPTPKKSFHVLKMLFNYLKYYEMVKQMVCENANKALSTYNDALDSNNALQVKNETAKRRAAKMEIELGEYEKKMPAIRERVDNCITDLKSLDQEIIQKNADIKNFESTIMKVELKQTELNEAVISEAEYNERRDKIQALKEELVELREVADHVRSSNVSTNAKISDLARTLDIINSVLNEQKLADYDELISIHSSLNSTAVEIVQQTQRIKDLNAEIKATVQNTEEILSKAKQMKLSTDQIQVDADAKNNELARTISFQDQEIDQLTNELSGLRSHVFELGQQQQFIVNSFLSILHTMSQPHFIPKNLPDN